jgi:hypothetical protein
VVDHRDGFQELAVYAIVWDTPDGHLIHLTPVYDAEGNGGAHPDRIALVAAELIEPVFWPAALIVQPITGPLGSDSRTEAFYLNLHRLQMGNQDGPSGPSGASRWGRLWSRTGQPAGASESRLTAVFDGLVTTSDVAAAVGTPVPWWIEGTCTRSTTQQAEKTTATLTVPDTITAWPTARSQLLAALGARMPEHYPAAFAALAADVRSTFAEVMQAQAAQQDKGEGWYLAARPAAPELPFAVEQIIADAETFVDLDQVPAELDVLRGVEADLPSSDPVGDAYEHAVQLLTWEMHQAGRQEAAGRAETYGDSFAGPVIDQWRQTLQPVPDRDGALETRRVRRLLRHGWSMEQVSELLADRHGRYVIVVNTSSGGPYFEAEWPYALPAGWTDKTIIAADPVSSGAVFALTPGEDGGLRVDPVPLDPGTGPSFGYGYPGGSPVSLYHALIRCVFGTLKAPFALHQVIEQRPQGAGRTDEKVSKLWHAIAATDRERPLRLLWPQIQQWAHSDAAGVGYTPGEGQPQ